MNVVVYDDECQAHEIKDVVISDKESITKLPIAELKQVHAVIINHDEHAFCKVRFDKDHPNCSLTFFEQNLHKVDNYLTRAVVWRHLWSLVEDCQLSPLSYYQFAVKQLPQETVEGSISLAIGHLTTLVGSYFPPALIPGTKKMVFEMLLQLLKTTTSETLRSTIVDKIFNFVSDEEHAKIVHSWNESEKIVIEGEHIFDLKAGQRYTIVSRLFKLKYLTQDQKDQVLE